MTSERPDTKVPEEAYVWIWLPGATAPVVAGRIARDGKRLIFNYGQSYLDRNDRIPVYEPELPLRSGAIAPEAGLAMPGCLRDAAPDAWGRRVILNRTFGHQGKDVEIAALDELTCLLESGSDRTGALDFQHSPSEYVPRVAQTATLEELLGRCRESRARRGAGARSRSGAVPRYVARRRAPEGDDPGRRHKDDRQVPVFDRPLQHGEGGVCRHAPCGQGGAQCCPRAA